MVLRAASAVGRSLGCAIVEIVLVCAAGVLPVGAQLLHASGERPSFAVASIRPGAADEQGHGSSGVGRFAELATVKELIKYAYGIGYDGELSGGPRWMATEKF